MIIWIVRLFKIEKMSVYTWVMLAIFLNVRKGVSKGMQNSS